MSLRRRVARKRLRIGRVSMYSHHGSWWLYYRENSRPVRRKVGQSRDDAQQMADQVNAQLTCNAPTALNFRPIAVTELRREFLDYHEQVLRSSVATVRRYRAATQHLANFSERSGRHGLAHQVRAGDFAAYLRSIEVAPNGSKNAVRRRLRDKGVQFILETVRSLYAYAGKHRYLPPYVPNPFAELPLNRLRIEDAKPIVVFDATTEERFLNNTDDWSFAIHITLAKTGLRVGELVHLLIEEVDLDAGWLRIRNKPQLGWQVKTRNQRDVPIVPEVVGVLRCVIGGRIAGPVFVRRRFVDDPPPLALDQAGLEHECELRRQAAGAALSREQLLRLARTVWRDAGALKADTVRQSFIHIAEAAGIAGATCPKSWRHSYATLLQDANVDPLIRQITLGHRPTTGPSLGMTEHYTHTRRETQRRQIETAIRLWPRSLELADAFAK